MTDSQLTPQVGDERTWRITARWQQFEGELRANLLRLLTLGVFYAIHLLRYWSDQGGLGGWLELPEGLRATPGFHLKITLLVATWAALAGGVHLCLLQRVFPRWLPAATTILDLFLLTSVLWVSNGARSPLVAGYFLVLAIAALRFDLRLVRLATLGAMLGYVCLLGPGSGPRRSAGNRARWPCPATTNW